MIFVLNDGFPSFAQMLRHRRKNRFFMCVRCHSEPNKKRAPLRLYRKRRHAQRLPRKRLRDRMSRLRKANRQNRKLLQNDAPHRLKKGIHQKIL